MWTTGWLAIPPTACDSRRAADGGLTPYLHVRADLWAKVTRALYYDLVDMGEERVVDGRAMFGIASGGRIFCDGRCGAGEGRALNEPMLKTEPAAISSAEFFDRSRARLRFDVPPGLIDPNIIPRSGDQGTDRMLEIIAREQPVRPAAVLIPVVDHPQPTVLLTQRAAHLNDHAGQISFPGGKIDATDASPLDAALREADEEIGLRREFIDPIGYLDLYATGFGFRILPTVARVKPGFKLRINDVRSGRRVRGAAGVPDGPREPSGAQQGIPRHGALVLRHAVRGTLYLGRDRGNSACAV